MEKINYKKVNRLKEQAICIHLNISGAQAAEGKGRTIK